MFQINTIGVKTAFLFEKRNKLYRQYSEVSIAEEKVVLAQEPLHHNWLCQWSGKGGVLI